MAVTVLGSFLTARRARLRPEDVGLVSHRARRVAGLRREEVAVLAGVSADYYARLEQGRERHPSASVLGGIARALDLDADAREHLFRLAGVPLDNPPAAAVEHVDAGLRQLLDAWPDLPAIVLNRRLDLLAHNAIAGALFADFADTANLARMTFLDPTGPVFFVDWQRAAETCVANLRLAHGHDPTDRRTAELVAELESASGTFRRLWRRHDVRGKTHEAKTFRHRAVGKLTLAYTAFDVRGTTGQQVIVYRAQPHSRDADALRLLTMLAAAPRLDAGSTRSDDLPRRHR
ncbi:MULTISPECIES: helix-turn-helix domain-containing protein [Micromonospora]|uniref:Transcriptional regulator, contains XRE-family HTH domain n=1 Tax=Micromonospora yangpuensis TaxID=683228 RepID=A0A1C6US77_9ACTN|nr:helix-turn-helix transcriptional regulator [Micromonospora yangpuensis]GGM06550.1 transcriptional regulator [Micromonospora yangpuensis]SCL56800.1 Transcriptional regulator, contains XRE-family HTH domain [Micromonospora yangpuensis]